MKFDIEDKRAIQDFSSVAGAVAVEDMFAEATKNKKESENSKEFRLSHISKMMTTVINPFNIKTASMRTDKYDSAVSTIDASKGDFTKYSNYKELKTLIETASVVASSESKKQSKHIETAKDTIKLLTDNRKDFIKAYNGKGGKKNATMFSSDNSKDKVDNALVITYRTLVLALIVETNLIAKAMVVGLTSEKEVKSFDEYVNSSKFFEKYRSNLHSIVHDKDIKVLISKVGDVTLIGESMQYFGNSIIGTSESTCIAEVSLVDVSLLLKLGVAKLMYKICSVFRFLIYIALYTKYSMDEKIDEIKKVLDFYNGDADIRSSQQEALEDKLVQSKVDDIKTFQNGEKDNATIEADTGFEI